MGYPEVAATRASFRAVVKTSAKDINLDAVKDRPAMIQRVIGRKSKLGFIHYVIMLLETNEDEDRRFTDKQLVALLLNEFSHSDRTLQSFEDGNQSMAKLRHEYNRGKYQARIYPENNPGHPPRVSLRYNEHRLPIHPKQRHILTNGALKAILTKLKDEEGKPRIQESARDLLTRLGRKGDDGSTK